MTNTEKRTSVIILLAAVIVSGVIGGLAGFMAAESFARSTPFLERLEQALTGRNRIIADRGQYAVGSDASIVEVVEQASPAVVSIIVTKDLPVVGRRPFGPDWFFTPFNEPDPEAVPETERREVGGGTGFIISEDGIIVTNKHVVADETADYSVLFNSGERVPATVLARDPSNDMAILKIEGTDFPVLRLGNSDELKVGQTVIAIGNALGEFRNTVSTGVVSGLARSVTALDRGAQSERLVGLIQTDASVNLGNSGGPLLDIIGTVVGINVALAQGAQNIGFAIPINQVKTAIDSVRREGRIVRAWLGVRYVMINPALVEAEKLAQSSGAFVVAGRNASEPAVMSGSPADKAGLQEGDIIMSVNGHDLTEDQPLASVISRMEPGDQLELIIWRDGKDQTIRAVLEEMT